MRARLAFAALLSGTISVSAADALDPRIVMLSTELGPGGPTPATSPSVAALPVDNIQPTPLSAWALHEAAIGDLEAWAKKLLNSGGDPDQRDARGYTPLMVAATFGSTRVARALLSHGANPLIADQFTGDSAIHMAARAGWIEVANLLLDHGVPINFQSKVSGDTPLHYAASIGSRRLIQRFVDQGAALNFANSSGIRPIQLALKHHRGPAVELLLQLGAHPDNLQDAVAAGDIARVQYFLGRGDDPNEIDLYGTALHRACATGQVYIANMLIDAGADLESSGEPSQSRPLHVAALNDQSEIVSLLVDRGADIEALDAEGRTPLMVAGKFKSVAAARTILNHGADINARDKIYRDPPIHFAVLSGSVEIVKLLLSQGIDVNLRSGHTGESPLIYPAIIGDVEMVKLLLARGADPRLSDNLGRTAGSIVYQRNSPRKLAIFRSLGMN